MKATFIIALIIIQALLAACSVTAPTPAPTAAPAARPAQLRLELPTDPEISDLPRLMAADTLREMGYNVQALDFQDNALSVQALEQGDLDVGYVSTATAWTAIQKGAKIATIVDDVKDARVLAVAPAIEKCTDLGGKQIAVPSLTSTQALILNQYLQENCPGTTYEPIIISSQTNRLVALTTAQVEAAVISYSNLREMERAENIKIKILVRFGEQFPNLRGATEVASRELREKYPATVRDLIRALLQARRKVQDPAVLSQQIVKYIKMEPAEARAAADLALESPLWELNGGLTPELVQSNLDFFVETGGIAAGSKPTDVADLSFLNDVLIEIGRK